MKIFKPTVILFVFLLSTQISNAQYTWEEVTLPDSIGAVDIAFNTNNEIFIPVSFLIFCYHFDPPFGLTDPIILKTVTNGNG